MDNEESTLWLIDALRETDMYIETIFTQGGCYKFHLFLATIFQNTTPLINKSKDHIISRVSYKCYDITGEVSCEGYSQLTPDEVKMCEEWSFSKRSYLSLGECPNCEEPLIV